MPKLRKMTSGGKVRDENVEMMMYSGGMCSISLAVADMFPSGRFGILR